MNFLTVDFDRKYARDHFTCVHPSLSNYIKLQATKESKSGLAKIYVLLNSSEEVIGYYSLSSGELPKEIIPDHMLKKLPNAYSGYPAILIGRLAVTEREMGKGLGGMLMVDAICRCIIHSQAIGTSVIMVDPIDKQAARFYEKYMFKSLPHANRMILRIDANLKGYFQLGE